MLFLLFHAITVKVILEGDFSAEKAKRAVALSLISIVPCQNLRTPAKLIMKSILMERKHE